MARDFDKKFEVYDIRLPRSIKLTKFVFQVSQAGNTGLAIAT